MFNKKKIENRLEKIEKRMEWIEDIRIDGIRDAAYERIQAIYDYLDVEEKSSKPLFLKKRCKTEDKKK